MYDDKDGSIALLPIDLKTLPGDYSLSAALVDSQGKTIFKDLIISVNQLERKTDRLTLPGHLVSPDTENLARIEREQQRLIKIFSQTTKRVWSTFVRPVDDEISSVFGQRRILNGIPKSPHSGTDFKSPEGTPVRSVTEGKVVLVADLFYTGETIIIDHGEGLFSLYAHLSESLVKEEEPVVSGDIIGRVGSTGRSTGAHLHITIKLLGVRIDPMAILEIFKPAGT
jgi:murein DD-endopeptidase MepM/ murein hydrolase activator NlpD